MSHPICTRHRADLVSALGATALHKTSVQYVPYVAIWNLVLDLPILSYSKVVVCRWPGIMLVETVD